MSRLRHVHKLLQLAQLNHGFAKQIRSTSAVSLRLLGAKEVLQRNTSMTPCVQNKRNFWHMLNAVANKIDRDRVTEVGAEKACAEWLLRNGAFVRWQGYDGFHKDYNTIPGGKFKLHIEEINADEASLMAIGFDHLDGVNHVKKVRFHLCPYLEDEAILALQKIKDSLEHLIISSCGDLTNDGIESLVNFPKLKKVVLQDLPGVRNKPRALKKLQEGLPECDINFKDIET